VAPRRALWTPGAMAPNRLLIFSPTAFQLSGHQQSYLTGLGEALVRLGVEVHVFGLKGLGHYPTPIVSHAVGRDTGVESRAAFRERMGPWGYVGWGAVRLEQQVRLFRELQRVHHQLGGPPLLFESFEYATLAAHLARAPRAHRQVCIFHDTNFNLRHTSPIAAAYRLLARPFARRILHSVDRAFVHASGMRENLFDNVDPGRRYRHKVEVLPYGAPHPEKMPRLDRAAARVGLGVDTRRKVMLAFGTLRTDKCYRLVFEALARSPEWELLVAGPEGDVSYRQLEALRAQTGTGQRVRMFPGFIPLGEHRQYFGAADAVLSLYEEHIRHESGTAQLARAFLRPVIAGGPPDLHDYVRATGAGWSVMPLNAGKLTEVLYEAARLDEAGRAAMERRIHAAAVARSWDAAAARVLAALDG
jgi:glycosyltransferase involved in cell wall biosynthesis